MFYIIGTAALAAAVIGFCVVLLGARNPRPSVWFQGVLVANVYVPLIIGIGIVGIGVLVRSIILVKSEPPSLLALAISMAIAAGAALAVQQMKVRERLAFYQRKQAIRDTIERVRRQRADARTDPGTFSGPDRPKRAA
ncbi:MAG: hypothetical protein LJE65_01965 [Desulfobacteraceae bacterium]|nr:hypothetical protein [Desulfobacteraceae bacterium]